MGKSFDTDCRGLSAIQLLPDEATPAMQIAYDAAQARRSFQKEILAGLNEALRPLGCSVSYSSFNRWVAKVRSGEVQRPVSKVIPEAAADILDKTFRVSLVSSVGEETTRAFERLLGHMARTPAQSGAQVTERAA